MVKFPKQMPRKDVSIEYEKRRTRRGDEHLQ